MSFSSYNPHDRYRNRFVHRLRSFVFVCLIMGAMVFFGFWLGQQSASQRISSLRQQVRDIQKQRDDLQESMTAIRTEAQTATMRYDQLQEKYHETIPDGPMQDLTALIRQQLEAGMDAERLTFAIRSARPPQNCSEPETRRFVISTPAYTGPESLINIMEGVVIIRGNGISARNDKGQPEAWYDPSKKIEVVFTTADGLTKKKMGVMPLHHSIVAGGREYRFTVEAGARSFAKVTFDSCDYP